MALVCLPLILPQRSPKPALWAEIVRKRRLLPLGSLAGSLAGGALASRILQGSAASTICAVVLGAATIEAAGAGALLCTIGVSGGIAYGTDKALSELSGATGEFIGEKLGLYEVTSND